MPVFKSLADFLINLSPRHNRPRSQERSAVRPTQPPPSTPPSRPARSGRQPLALQPRTENNDPVEPTPPRNPDSAARPKVSTHTSMRVERMFAFGGLHSVFIRAFALNFPLNHHTSISSLLLVKCYRRLFNVRLINVPRFSTVMSIPFHPHLDPQQQVNACTHDSQTSV